MKIEKKSDEFVNNGLRINSELVCPVCGKFFASVRCPNCGRIGSTEEFKDGCPSCGYAMRPDGTYYFRKGFKGKEKSGKKSSFELFEMNIF